jgi:hypothetical protein
MRFHTRQRKRAGRNRGSLHARLRPSAPFCKSSGVALSLELGSLTFSPFLRSVWCSGSINKRSVRAVTPPCVRPRHRCGAAPKASRQAVHRHQRRQLWRIDWSTSYLLLRSLFPFSPCSIHLNTPQRLCLLLHHCLYSGAYIQKLTQRQADS